MKKQNNPDAQTGKKSLRFMERILITGVFLWFLGLIVVPFCGILKQTFSKNWHQAFASLTSSTALHSFGITIIICIAVAIINTIFGTMLAYMLTRQTFRGQLIIESLLDLPFAVSPVVIGFMLIILFGPNGWMGRIFSFFNIKIIYALPGMIIATLF
ncbi:MAG: sulfate ABC transporter permease subunit CysW, partial [Candidatus Aminicenantes bacterium]|nr:sulfate ABC transporter permease subunit CysW [Candidatus Aminicenantes bacterium]